MQQAGVWIEEQKGRVKDSVLGVVSYLREQGKSVCAFVLSDSPDHFAEQLAKFGVTTICAIVPEHREQSVDPQSRAHILAEAMQAMKVNTLFGLTSPLGRDLLPRIAALFDGPLVMDCTRVDLENMTASTSNYSGKTEAIIRVCGKHLFFGMRPNYHRKVSTPCSPEVIEFRPEAEQVPGIEFTGMTAADQGTDLSEATIIISGGRGLKNGENFRILFDCARELGAGVGASRVAVDKGWVPYTMQVGQTGVRVNPRVYIACGISGSVQHFAGMKTAGMIIAVNKDAEAPIIAKSDYYILGDLFRVIPKLTERLQARDQDKGS